MVRPVDWTSDGSLILEALNRLTASCKANPTKRIHKYINPDKAFAFMQENGSAHIVEGYLVYFAASEAWYADVWVLTELLVVRLGPGGVLRDVVRFLDEEATKQGIPVYAVGTAFAPNDKALARIYQRAGMVPEAITLTRSTPWDLLHQSSEAAARNKLPQSGKAQKPQPPMIG